MVDRETVLDRIDRIRSSVTRLKELSKFTEEEFVSDDDYFAIAEHHLRRTIEAVLDIGRHICVSDNLGQPARYKDILIMLGEEDVLEQEFADEIKGIAGYRNRLVHMYNEITKQELYEILQTKLEDFEEFCRQIIDYIQHRSLK